jgi:hypothetical protein
VRRKGKVAYQNSDLAREIRNFRLFNASPVICASLAWQAAEKSKIENAGLGGVPERPAVVRAGWRGLYGGSAVGCCAQRHILLAFFVFQRVTVTTLAMGEAIQPKICDWINIPSREEGASQGLHRRKIKGEKACSSKANTHFQDSTGLKRLRIHFRLLPDRSLS